MPLDQDRRKGGDDVSPLMALKVGKGLPHVNRKWSGSRREAKDDEGWSYSAPQTLSRSSIGHRWLVVQAAGPRLALDSSECR